MERSGVRILSHPGQTDESRLSALEQQAVDHERRLKALERENAELLDLLHQMTRVAATEHDKKVLAHDALADRVRELELAQP